jgi:cytochrome c biogenesis protein CcmG, thiol:disulfide interchange protein DsbE
MTQPPGDRRARRQAARAAARGGGERRSPASRWLLPGLIAAAVVVAAILAVVLPGASGPTGGGSSSVPPSASGAGASGGSGSPVASGSDVAVQPPVITGAPLPPFEGPDNDGAVGLPAPEVSATDFDGTPVTIAADGRAKAILFLAHWCPHCQAEVPLVQTWVSAGGVPEGVDLVSVATGIDPAQPNYPPEAWLEREGWTPPVIADPTNTVAAAYGLTLYPFWVFVGADGTVVARAAGAMSIPDLEALVGRLTAG